MKFGKEIQSNQIPGWSAFYLDYKGLKKIVSSLENALDTAHSSPSPVAPISPAQLLGASVVARGASELQALPPDASAPLTSSSAFEDDRGPIFQAHKAAFFYKLERELEKINAFYLQKEAELKARLTTLLSKRQAASRRLQDSMEEDASPDGVEWRAVEEGFRLLEKDLGKMQQFIEINATGFRKILKKWDKRSKSRTKELYLARQVEIQPCFNRQLLAELSDSVATCLLDLSDPGSLSMQYTYTANSSPTGFSDTPASGIISQSSPLRRMTTKSAFSDLESSMTKAVAANDQHALRDMLGLAERLLVKPTGDAASPDPDAVAITRILWKAAIEAPPPLADLIMSSKGYDIHYVDDINGRTCLHSAAIAGELRMLELCVQNGLEVNRADFYGRCPLHYASMNGHNIVCQRLLALGADPSVLDKDNYNPLIYSIVNGHVSCVRVLLSDPRVGVEPVPGIADLIPLSLACQFGHAEIVALLLQQGAQKLPNTNGQYPLHLAAQEGHASLCRMLLAQGEDAGKDVPDKYNEWTPLFHASRHGHRDVVQVLLEAGCNPDAVDETGTSPVFYAAWYGYIPCVELLLQATTKASSTNVQTSAPSSRPEAHRKTAPGSPGSDFMLSSDEPDLIPSLSLPPPIMPFRIYGHNYLDRTYLVQITLGHPCSPSSSGDASKTSPVQLLPNKTVLNRGSILNPGTTSREPSLKLLIAPKADSTSAPHTVTLPLVDQEETFVFQVKDLKDLTIEFSFYPSFGSKAIGRAVGLPGMFVGEEVDDGNDGSKPIVLPILDHRLHVIGQIAFEACLISPFSGAKLEVGGTLETYWKSTTVGPSGLAPLPSRVLFGNASGAGGMRSPGAASNTNSPAVFRQGTTGGGTQASGGVILSSLTGEYIHVIVQVTRDLVPVVCPSFRLPVDGYDLGVADVTVDQFLALARSSKANIVTPVRASSSGEWHKLLSRSLITLEQLLEILPPHLGICLELALPAKEIRQQNHLGRHHKLNAFVDAILQVIFTPSGQSSRHAPRRKVVFSSYEPNVCVAVNWKQPNYAVFFMSDCGLESSRPPPDPRCASLDAAVAFAKSNNILGILVNASLLVRVTSLIPAVKDSGVLLAAFGARDQLGQLSTSPPTSLDSASSTAIDAILQDGVLSYVDYSSRITG